MVIGQKPTKFILKSPDASLEYQLEVGKKLIWTLKKNNQALIIPSPISLEIGNDEILGQDAKVLSSKLSNHQEPFYTPIYKKNKVENEYNELKINFKGSFGIIIRAYDEGLAYRFILNRKNDLIIKSEESNFNFAEDFPSYISYTLDYRGPDQFGQSFESLYTQSPLSQMKKDTIAFLPALVSMNPNNKMVITEADLENYPGMFILPNGNGKGFKGVFAPYPLKEAQAGFRKLNTIPIERANYIAQVKGTRSLPWRVVVVSNHDLDLANSDLVRELASPSRLKDESWIKPGKVAWDWWNDWNISHVDFRAGINTETYKYYIDFAAENHLEYIIMDEGWSNSLDLMDLSPNVDLKAIIDYGKQKNVGVILWATWYAVQQKLESGFSKYAAMGVKGFKIDFMDRDDQKMVSSLYQIAEMGAKYHLLIDYHGMYKPTGINRTYPNLINFEGVKGMENAKWAAHDDVPQYELLIPYIRMLAGPMDYTPGAMRNFTKDSFRPINSQPGSQGTRCHQMAMYTVFEAPLQMLADNPTIYKKEQECTDFISKVPTTFDQTIALDGKLGEYILMARKKGDTWFLGAMSNWDPHDLSLNLSFLGSGNYEAEIFQDGINADRDATDYKRIIKKVNSKDILALHLMNGGGWTARIYPIH